MLKEDYLNDEFFMKQALQEAMKAWDKDEVPVGAVVVAGQSVIARAHNLTETLNDVTAHAEMQVITAATHHLGSKYLDECILYVTLEPCTMCAGAIFWAQVGKLVYGAPDPRRGFQTLQVPVLHPRTEVLGGILSHEAESLLKDFFKRKRT